jgi:hypothetical protein
MTESGDMVRARSGGWMILIVQVSGFPGANSGRINLDESRQEVIGTNETWELESRPQLASRHARVGDGHTFVRPKEAIWLSDS